MSTSPRTLRDLVDATGVPISRLAEAHGLSRVSLHRWIAGDRKPHGFMLPRLAEALGVTLDEVRAALEETARRHHAGEE